MRNREPVGSLLFFSVTVIRVVVHSVYFVGILAQYGDPTGVGEWGHVDIVDHIEIGMIILPCKDGHKPKKVKVPGALTRRIRGLSGKREV